MEERKVAGNLIYKKNSGLNELLKLANPSPPSSIYKQKIWLLAPGPGFWGGGAGWAQRDGDAAGCLRFWGAPSCWEDGSGLCLSSVGIAPIWGPTGPGPGWH